MWYTVNRQTEFWFYQKPNEYYIQIYEVASISKEHTLLLFQFSISRVRFRLIDSITKCEDMGMLLIESNWTTIVWFRGWLLLCIESCLSFHCDPKSVKKELLLCNKKRKLVPRLNFPICICVTGTSTWDFRFRQILSKSTKVRND